MVLISADISEDMGIFWREIVYNNKSHAPIFESLKIFLNEIRVFEVLFIRREYMKNLLERGKHGHS